MVLCLLSIVGSLVVDAKVAVLLVVHCSYYIIFRILHGNDMCFFVIIAIRKLGMQSARRNQPRFRRRTLPGATRLRKLRCLSSVECPIALAWPPAYKGRTLFRVGSSRRKGLVRGRFVARQNIGNLWPCTHMHTWFDACSALFASSFYVMSFSGL